VAGFNALRYFQERYPGQVIGIRPVQTASLRGAGIVALNAEDRSGLRSLFATHCFQSVLNCVGNCALKSCELDPREIGVSSVFPVRLNRTRDFACQDIIGGKGGYGDSEGWFRARQGWRRVAWPPCPISGLGTRMVASPQA